MSFLLLTRVALHTFHLHDTHRALSFCGTLDQLAIHARMRRLPISALGLFPALQPHQLRIVRIGDHAIYLEPYAATGPIGRVLSFPAALQLLHTIAVRDQLSDPRGVTL